MTNIDQKLRRARRLEDKRRYDKRAARRGRGAQPHPRPKYKPDQEAE